MLKTDCFLHFLLYLWHIIKPVNLPSVDFDGSNPSPSTKNTPFRKNWGVFLPYFTDVRLEWGINRAVFGE